MKRPFDLSPFARRTVTLAELLELDRTGPDRFRSRHSQPNSYSGIFGGQLLAHALGAADLTTPQRTVHSLHAYFLRTGDAREPLDFAVERIRDGGRFSSRRVLATQDDRLLFTMDCSYRVALEGFEHQIDATQALGPTGAINLLDLDLESVEGMASIAGWAGSFPIEARIPSREGFMDRSEQARRHYWLRAPTAASIESPAVQNQILAFMSDWLFSGVPLSPHTKALPGPHIFVASLDHSIWFHRPVRCNEWLLFQTDSPSARSSVNLARGLVYDRTGALVASIAQEALQQIL